MPGTLFVVATPIGNLEDLTFRALRILGEVDLVAAEDTRRTSKLLAHYELRKPLVSLHEHNEQTEASRLVDRLSRGESIALVSDAGTPGISDPGSLLVRAARAAGIRVVPVPGPSSVAAALSVAGLPGSEFTFLGFPPSSGAERERWLERLWRTPHTAVFFEAPHRITRTINDCRILLGNRQTLWFKELSKVHESFGEYPIDAPGERGEFTVVVGPPAPDVTSTPVDSDRIANIFGRLTDHGLFSEDEAVALTSCALGVSPAAVRKAAKRARFAAARHREASS